MKTTAALLLALLCATTLPAQDAYRAFFIGNSYTAANNLPLLIRELTLSAGDTLTYESSIPGGYTFQSHTTNANTLNFLAMPGWDYVIMQEQSQRPSFSQSQVQQEVYPYATILDSLAHVASPCAKTVFYMTWGRKYGDSQNCAVWPPVCTYEGMQVELRRSYLNMAQQNNAIVAPVGIAWWEAMRRDSTIELYVSDGSHPSLEGSYLAACVFYATMYRTTPVGLSYHATLSSAKAAFYQDVAADIVFDSLTTWRIGLDDPQANFSTSTSGATASFTDLSSNATSWTWDFGDGSPQVTQQNPTHTYASSGTYVVLLYVSDGCSTSTFAQAVQITIVGQPDPFADLQLLPNPSAGQVLLRGTWPAAEPIAWTLIDLQGRTLRQGSLPAAQELNQRMDFSGLAAGAYHLRLSSPARMHTLRVLLR
jgi:PKD domain